MVQDYSLLGSNSFLNHFIKLEGKIKKKYKHFDSPTSRKILFKILNVSFKKRNFYPMIKIEKEQKSIKKENGIIFQKNKKRTIMYASHTDSIIYKFVGSILNYKLEKFYESEGMCKNIAAYRSRDYLGNKLSLKSNYDWSSFVYEKMLEKLESDNRIKPKNSLCIITTDVKDFFGTINHKKLKRKICNIMNFDHMPDDWYTVFKNVTKFSYVEKDILEKFAISKNRNNFSITKLKENGAKIHKNTSIIGIPQGNPISSTLSNLYMMDLDKKIINFCRKRNITYIRYSDDIIFICRESQKKITMKILKECMKKEELTLSKNKTNIVLLNKETNKSFNYLGFTLSLNGASIRSSSINKMLIKFKKINRMTLSVACKNQDLNISKIMYTKNIYRKFSTINYYNKSLKKTVYADNFFSYARKSAKSFSKVGGDNITKQINKIEKKISNKINSSKKVIEKRIYNNII